MIQIIKITQRTTTPHVLPYQKVEKMASFPVKNGTIQHAPSSGWQKKSKCSSFLGCAVLRGKKMPLA